MPLIPVPIPPQSFELIRNRIADILIDEFENQFTVSSDPDLNLEFTVESASPIDKVEPPLINVSFSLGDFNNKNQGSADGTFTYNIDCYALAKSTDSESGDSKSSIKLQRLLGMCYAILSDPKYKTLGYMAPFILRSSCGQINIAEPGKRDASSITMGRLTLTVLAVQANPLIVPELIEGYDTMVKMSSSSRGYKFTGENYL